MKLLNYYVYWVPQFPTLLGNNIILHLLWIYQTRINLKILQGLGVFWTEQRIVEKDLLHLVVMKRNWARDVFQIASSNLPGLLPETRAMDENDPDVLSKNTLSQRKERVMIVCIWNIGKDSFKLLDTSNLKKELFLEKLPVKRYACQAQEPSWCANDIRKEQCSGRKFQMVICWTAQWYSLSWISPKCPALNTCPYSCTKQ